jgi:hypothetical protein
MKTSRIFYKDISAVKAETEKLAVTFLPEYGGKCASVKDKKSGREFLSQASGEHYKKLAYDGDYVAAECSGFDDMFPTIDKYYYDRYPWQGVPVPDHGEVCGLEWKYETKKSALRMWTHSPRFGYKFEKTISEIKDGVSIDYLVTNNTQFTIIRMALFFPLAIRRTSCRIWGYGSTVMICMICVMLPLNRLRELLTDPMRRECGDNSVLLSLMAVMTGILVLS